MTAPLVSVVIATRDRPQMVREAIDAALAQDYAGPIEVILVFDQSDPDMSLERSDDNRSVRVITNTRRPGLAGSRNTGIAECRGTYVAYCDDDDYWLPSKVRIQVAAMEQYPDAALGATGIRIQYDGEEFDRVLDVDLVRFESFLRDRHAEIHSSTLMMRRDVLMDQLGGGIDEDVPGGFGEDYEFLLRAARIHPIVNVREPLSVIRWGKQSFFFRRWETMAAGLSFLLARYPEFETDPRGSARIHGQIAFAKASMGRRREAWDWIKRTVRRSPREPRAYIALAVTAGVVKPDWVMDQLHQRGKGI